VERGSGVVARRIDLRRQGLVMCALPRKRTWARHYWGCGRSTSSAFALGAPLFFPHAHLN
jgi:hypothetical protein